MDGTDSEAFEDPASFVSGRGKETYPWGVCPSGESCTETGKWNAGFGDPDNRFGMFGGEEQTVKLLMASSMAGVIINRFGKDVMLVPMGDS